MKMPSWKGSRTVRNIKQEQIEARVAETKRKEKEQLKRYRLLMKEISTGDGKVSDR